jgi:hypothetical protein
LPLGQAIALKSGSSQRIYVLFFISLGTRRIEYVACTSNPDRGWVARQARNLIKQFGDEQPFRPLVHDRDTKFSHAFDEVFRIEGIRVIRRRDFLGGLIHEYDAA